MRLQEFENEVQESLNKLKPIYKEVLLLCDFGKSSYEEVSTALNISVSTVGVRLMRARKLFMKYLKGKF